MAREVACLVCGHSGLDPHLDILLRCPGCGFVTAGVQGSVDLRGLYQGDYFTGREYLDYPGDEAFFRRNFRQRLEAVLARRRSGRLLEIGAAYGFFLDLARRHFQVIGYEVNTQAADHARRVLGLDVRTQDFLQVTLADLGGLVEVTVMWDVIEHLERPDRFLARIAELSAPGALLFLTTGDIGSRLARWRGRRWRLIHPPSHLHYFDRRTITRLLHNHGFRVLDIRAVGVARSVRQALYSVLALGLGLNRAYRSLERLVPPSWGLTINTFDIMQVVAEKNR